MPIRYFLAPHDLPYLSPATLCVVTPDRNVPVLNEEVVVHFLDCRCDFRFLVDYRVQSIAGGKWPNGRSYNDGYVNEFWLFSLAALFFNALESQSA